VLLAKLSTAQHSSAQLGRQAGIHTSLPFFFLSIMDDLKEENTILLLLFFFFFLLLLLLQGTCPIFLSDSFFVFSPTLYIHTYIHHNDPSILGEDGLDMIARVPCT
jgi:hypothetical protein